MEWRSEVVEEVRRQLRVAVPLFTAGLLQFSVQAISVMFVGHVGELELAGASMAASFTSVTGFTLLMGMAIGLETLCGQSYGAKEYKMVGIHMQRAVLVLVLMSLFISVIWANTRHILLVLHQDPDISKEAGRYAMFMIPSLFAYGPLQGLVKFLQTQNNVVPMMITSGITAAMHILVCWVLVFKSGLGSRGAALSTSISYWVNVALLCIYVKSSSSCNLTWTGFSAKAFERIPLFLKVAVPSALMCCFKVWTFEVVVLLSGLLPNPKLETSVLSICLNTSGLVWMIPFGLGGAVSIRVSNELGAGRPEAARLAARVVLFLGMVNAVVIGVLLVLVRNIWGRVYTSEEEVINHLAAMMLFLAASNSLDAIQSVLSGIANGCGWQRIGAFVNLVAYYLVGIPLAVPLAFVLHLNVKGFWLGIICAFVVQLSCLLIITIRTNWEEEARKASERVYGTIAAAKLATDSISGPTTAATQA